jgi:hypothetical protein
MNQYDDHTNQKAKDVGFQYAHELERSQSHTSLSNAVGSGAYTHIATVLSRTYLTGLIFEHAWRKCTKTHDTWIQFKEMHKYLTDENLDDFAKLAINTKVDHFIKAEAGGSGIIRSALAATTNKPNICTI